MCRVSKAAASPGRSDRGSLYSAGKAGTVTVVYDQGVNPGRWTGKLLRRAIAPRFLVSLDSVVPPALSDPGLKVWRYLGHVLTLAHHATSHLVAVGIDYPEG